MKLRGYSGCSGFSFTPKYKESIIAFYSWVNDNANLGIVKYKVVQELIEESGGCRGSETRMIVPFMVKSGIINKASCKWRGSKMHAINTKNLFTKTGESFIQFLKIEAKREELENETVKLIIKEIYEKFAKIQFYYLFNSDEVIYKGLVQFLLEYKRIDKLEFFILSTLMQEDDMGNLDKVIKRYRNKEYEDKEFEIAYNINAFAYTSNLLVQYNLFQRRGESIILNPKHDSFFRDLIDNSGGIVNGRV